MPISGMTPHMGWMGGNINNPARQAAYRAATERVLRRHRNHPSISCGELRATCLVHTVIRLMSALLKRLAS
jgi:hypothetical protein